jgi:hypothetical protein
MQPPRAGQGRAIGDPRAAEDVSVRSVQRRMFGSAMPHRARLAVPTSSAHRRSAACQEASMTDLYDEAFRYTRPTNGQYPRPWMTDLDDPLVADCFVVGRNQRNGYEVAAVGDQRRHVDALFNRNGESCRGLYDSLFNPSPTRRNIDRLSMRLKAGGAKVLETNVICFSSPMSSDLSPDQRSRGREVFAWILARILPDVIIVHGSGAARELGKLDSASAKVIEMPALAPPAYNRWHSGSEAELDNVADRAISVLRAGGAGR